MIYAQIIQIPLIVLPATILTALVKSFSSLFSGAKGFCAGAAGLPMNNSEEGYVCVLFSWQTNVVRYKIP